MSVVDVVVPWRGGCSHRERALAWVVARYAARHPNWTVTVAQAAAGAWSKATAVMPAIHASSADIIVVADADVWCDDLQDAVDALGQHGWAIPHTQVRRLTEHATANVLAGADPAAQETLEAYRGVPGGGYVIATREQLVAVPLDPRFEGWGCEDVSWAMALHTVAGPSWRGEASLTHLWHPPQPRPTRRRGSAENERLRRRYGAARRRPVVMRQLLAEAHLALQPLDPVVHDHAPLAV